MIPKSKTEKKPSFTNLPDSLNQQLAQTFSKMEEVPEESPSMEANVVTESKVEFTEESTEVAKKIPATKKQNREGQINICIPPEIKTEWKVLFASCNVNMTQGITFAIEHLKHEIDNGEAILTIGGVISKRK